MPKKISFVIPFVHEYHAIDMTIHSCMAEMQDSDYNWEIVIVENGTEDIATPKVLTGDRATFRVPKSKGLIQYHFEDRQCGPIARNTGAKNATGDFILLIDAHTVHGQGSPDTLANHLVDNPECGGAIGLVAKSHYDLHRMGAHHELFHYEKEMRREGGPTLFTHMHGTYMPYGRVQGFAGLPPDKKPYKTVVGSQAYAMYRRDDYLRLGGAGFEECRFYPHPEGYLPLKVWLSGMEMNIVPEAWHFHGNWPRMYTATGPERRKKIREYGETIDDDFYGWTQGEHGHRNVMMIGYIVGGEKYFNLTYEALKHKHNPRFLDLLKESGRKLAEPEYDKLSQLYEHTLDEILIMARKNKFAGMENWDPRCGSDPL